MSLSLSLCALQTLNLFVRPDIAYAVGVLSRFTSKPSKDHWLAIKRVMRYLIGTKSYGLFYKKYPTMIEAFSDADWNTL